MDVDIQVDNSSDRASIYSSLLPQISSLIEHETDLIANLANVAAVLRTHLGFFWVGFYLVKESSLVLGPFQGELACTRIDFGKGVCGTAWQTKATQRVPDVDQFAGHIACSSASRSELVVPILLGDDVVAVLDIDSDQLDDFTETDQYWIEQLADKLGRLF